MSGWVRAIVIGSVWGTIIWWGFAFNPEHPGAAFDELIAYIFTWVLIALVTWLLIRRVY